MKKILVIFLLTLVLCTNVYANETISKNTLEPRASDVFISVGSAINRSNYGGDCTLFDDGYGSVQIILQKQNDYNKFWYTYDGQNYIKGFSNTAVCSYSKSYNLPAGKFRCKTIITATLNGVTDTRTVYSPELTIYD